MHIWWLIHTVCTYVFLLTYIGTYYVQMTLLSISNIIAGPCATYNSWTIHSIKCMCNGLSSYSWKQVGPNVAVYGALDGPAIKGSKGDQMWQYTVQWMVQLSKVARGTKCGSIYTVQ